MATRQRSLAESGVQGYSVWPWYGVLAPARTPKAVVNKLQQEIAAVLELPELRDRYLKGGFEPIGNSPEEFGRQIRSDLARWGKVVRDANIKVE